MTFPQIDGPSPLDKMFYFATGFGHQAVMVFFVLSGYFVAGALVDSVANQRWSWKDYALRRLTRLWLVLLPALLLTLLWDAVGMQLTGGAGYDGRFSEVLNSGPSSSPPLDSGLFALLGNVLFLQTIVTPVFGSNSPLWSLANEFWYYLLFPLGYLVFRGSSSVVARFAFGGLASGIALWLPGKILGGLGIWLLGYAVHLLLKNDGPCRNALGHPLAFAVSCVTFLASLCISRAGASLGTDYLVGVAFAGMMPFLILHTPTHHGYTRLAKTLSEISYTLYVVHFPVLAFLFFTLRLPQKSAPGLGSYAEFFCLLVLVLSYATIVWWCFESRTDSVRRWLETRLSGAPVKIPSSTARIPKDKPLLRS